MTKRSFIARVLFVCGFLSTCCIPAIAQSDYPNKPVKIIVPFPPGGTTDIMARISAEQLTKILKQAFVIENISGGGGVIGAERAAVAPADGYTLVMTGVGQNAVAHGLDPNLKYDSLKDFAHISLIDLGPNVLVVNPDRPFKTLKDIVDFVRANPGKLDYGYTYASSGHMAMELLKLETKIFMLHVPYRGTAGYTQDLLAGELMVGFLPVHVAQGFVKSGKLNALAVGSTKRHPVAADVPTFLELGYKDIDVDLWYAFFVPTKTPTSTVSKLHADLNVIIAQPAVKDILGKAGLDASASTPEELASIVAKDYPRWGRVIQLKGITGE